MFFQSSVHQAVTREDVLPTMLPNRHICVAHPWLFVRLFVRLDKDTLETYSTPDGGLFWTGGDQKASQQFPADDVFSGWGVCPFAREFRSSLKRGKGRAFCIRAPEFNGGLQVPSSP